MVALVNTLMPLCATLTHVLPGPNGADGPSVHDLAVVVSANN